MRLFNITLLLILPLLLVAGCNSQNNESVSVTEETTELGTEFNARNAWDEFEEQFRFRYAYLKRDDFDVDAQLAISKKLALQSKTKIDFRRILQKTSYAFTDPHFIVGPFEDNGYNIIPTSADMTVRIEQGRFFVNDVRAGSAAHKAGILPNWEIISINNVKTPDAARLPFSNVIGSPTPAQFKYAAILAVNGRRKGSRSIVFNTGNNTKIIELASPRDFAFEVSELPILKTSKIGTVGVIRFNNSLGNNDTIQAFDAAVDELLDSSGLIIDLRNTPSGGNTEVARSVIGHFVNDIRGYQIHEIPSLEREFTVPRRFIEQVKPRKPYFDPKKVVVLGGFWTGSMGEGVLIGLHGAAGTHTIASDMGDLLGGLRNISLDLSSSRLDIGDEALFHVNGTPREAFIADKPLQSSDVDKNGDDPSLKEALSYLSQAN